MVKRYTSQREEEDTLDHISSNLCDNMDSMAPLLVWYTNMDLYCAWTNNYKEITMDIYTHGMEGMLKHLCSYRAYLESFTWIRKCWDNIITSWCEYCVDTDIHTFNNVCLRDPMHGYDKLAVLGYTQG